MKKRNAATMMAAAMTLATVAPAFAAEPQTLDVRPATGYKLITNEDGTIKVYTRAQAFNTNFTDDVKDDTLKVKNAVVVKEFEGATVAENKYILAEKVTTEAANVAKTKMEALKAEISEYKANTAYKVVENAPTDFVLNQDGTVQNTKQEVVVTKVSDNTEVAKYVFNGVEYTAPVEATDSVASLAKLFAGIDTTIELGATDGKYDQAQYFEYNKVKYVLESNADKFDVVKTELNDTNLQVDVYKKGTEQINDNKVATFTYNNIKTINNALVVNMPAKTDVDGHWAEKEIKEAMLRQMVAADANFRPKDGITRAEFAKIVTRTFGIAREDADLVGKDEPFSDVKKGDWFYNDIVALYNVNGQKGAVVGGYEDETFRPNAQITRQEAAKMIAAAYDLTKAPLSVAAQDADDMQVVNVAKDGIVENTMKVNGSVVDRDIKTKFTDDKEIASWADESVEALKAASILSGNPDGAFNAKSQINRAEAVSIMVRIANK